VQYYLPRSCADKTVKLVTSLWNGWHYYFVSGQPWVRILARRAFTLSQYRGCVSEYFYTNYRRVGNVTVTCVCDTWERYCESVSGSESTAARILTFVSFTLWLLCSRCSLNRRLGGSGMHSVDRAKSLSFSGIKPGPNVCSSNPSVFYRPCETSPATAHPVILTFRLYTNNELEKFKR
jgi:hypothetical protein